ncbi:GntR family transcriptional regulator [Alkalihalobacillus trypoxylicola]|uniref:GntR family transcriptional regulator n=1 Tax=Alkalihalobacillus trypoxylicola TaxID=519424 RepID=A0A161QP98_9BACI|nr:GntR family transcriptional regulator [Alkalihalobacillus trypoxylicola]KYG34842.1 GntR family transcriptional regulator [Alkalihalobacillus trypoxylicola]
MQTKYRMVKDRIKERILAGEYQANQRIDSESQLMKQHEVSRHTVRMAIGELVNEGWLYREQGAGTFVQDKVSQKEEAVHTPKSIAIITTFISDYIFPSIIRGAESYLSEKGYQVSLFSTNNDSEKEKSILEKIIQQRFDGVIIEPTKSAYTCPNLSYYFQLEKQQIPYIMINGYYEELEPAAFVINDEKGGFIQTEHLIERNHREIAGFFKTDDRQGVQRLKGFIKAHRKHSIDINPEHIITYTSEVKSTKPLEELKKLLDHRLITGIVCYNDELAVLMLNELRTRKMAVPSQISLVGFDNSFLSEATEVKLTTIEHPKNELGYEAAESLVSIIENPEQTSLEMKQYEPKLIIRKSTSYAP